MKNFSPPIPPRHPIENDPRWPLVVARDRNADGRFFYSVKTTGVYCRPSCAARLARPANVRFHRTRLEAESAGFRPCKRCKPDQPSLAAQYADKVTRACRLIETTESAPTLQALARSVALSPYHFHRIFKAATGLTPKQYASAQRAKRVRETLHRSSTVTEAIFNAGYNSHGRFYQEAPAILGMTPGDYRDGGVNASIRFAVDKCSLGWVLVAQSTHGVCAILLGENAKALERELRGRFPGADFTKAHASFKNIVTKVIEFIESPGIELNLPLDIRGTAFQQRVWRALCQIPPGHTASYTDIAKRIGAPKSVRAVAQACGANALAVAIPCHRVVRSDGALSGYRWGVERKRVLLDKESKKRAHRNGNSKIK